MTSFIGTGIYFLASREITSANCFPGTGGIVIKVIRLEESGKATPAYIVVVFASRKISFKASISFAFGRFVDLPTSVPA